MQKILLFICVPLFTVISALPITNVVLADETAKSPRHANAAIRFRKSIFQLVRSNIIPLGAMAKGKAPYDDELVEKNATRIMQLSAMIPDYFALNTDKYSTDSTAKREIWSNLDDFNSKAQDLYTAAATLQALAKDKNQQQYKAAIGDIRSACKACHERYRTK